MLKTTHKIVGLSALLVIVASDPTYSDEHLCAPHKQFSNFLKSTLGEIRVGTGLLAEGHMIVEILANTETGTWKILYIVNENACQVVSGTDYHIIDN